MEVMLVEFVELRGVPVFFNVCSTDCRDKTVEKYGDKNIQMQKEIDVKYAKEILEANRMNAQDISVDVNALTRGRSRQRRRCAIM